MKRNQDTSQTRIHDRATRLAAIQRMDRDESPTLIARELGISRSILYRWRAAEQKRASANGASTPAQDHESAELARLRAENRKLRDQISALRRAVPVLMGAE